jgi:DNA polymerase-3 subunit epsilon
MRFKKPIAFLDFESTGVDVVIDRIVQIALIKILPTGLIEEYTTLVNPEMEIPEQASEVHGITNEMVKDAPTFKDICKEVEEFLDGCDIGGYNSNSFDIPMMCQEFYRCDIIFPLEGKSFIDVLNIEKELNPRTLGAVYFRYTGKELEGAHDALNDVRATIEIFKHQMEKGNLPKNVEKIDAFSQGKNKRVDLAGKLVDIDGDVCWGFGKHKGKHVTSDVSYINWFFKQSVPIETRKIIEKELLKKKIYLKGV